jgi:hypothetical protein
MKYAKGVCWVDDTRIPHNEEIMVATDYKETKQSETGWNIKNRILEPSNRGRFTPNLLVCDDMLNDGNIGGNNSNKFYEPQYEDTSNIYGKYKQLQVTQYKDKGSSSRYYDLDKWFDKIIDEIQ